jgi:hypothetical protein
LEVHANVTRFVELVVNDSVFRAEISSGNKERIKAALQDPNWAFTLSPQEAEAAADALIRAGNLGSLSNLEEILSHNLIGIRGN